MTELREIEGLNIGNLPINNLAPLLQGLSDQGLKIRHFKPFLLNTEARKRLAINILARGHHLSDPEVKAAETLGWNNVLLAPVVLDQLGMAVRHVNLDISRNIPDAWNFGLLKRCAGENWDNRSQCNDGWRLIYLTGLSLKDLHESCWNQEVRMVIHSGKNHQSGEQPVLFDEPFFTQKVTPGYYLINFLPTETVYSTEGGWQKIQTITKILGTPLSAAAYAQALLLCAGINREFPIPSSTLAHWAFQDEKFDAFVDIWNCKNPEQHQVIVRLRHGTWDKRFEVPRVRCVYSIS